MKQVIALFPGQGSQSIGMCKDFHDSSTATNMFDQTNEILGWDIVALIKKGPMPELTATQNLQPAISLMNAVCLYEMTRLDIKPIAVAGHSLGELSAAFCAGVYDFAELIQLSQLRGERMAQAAAENVGTMMAVASDQHDAIIALVDAIAGKGLVINAANINSPKQIVISGATDALERFRDTAMLQGLGRITPLPVSGAWHSKYMEACKMPFSEKLNSINMCDAQMPFYANVSASPENRAAQIKSNLINQITAPVQWLQTLRLLRANYPDAIFAEVGPGKVLTGLMLQTDPRAKIFQINSKRGLDRFVKAVNS
jgi:[acyl-carrier-protein] S-malonyltransferase